MQIYDTIFQVIDQSIDYSFDMLYHTVERGNVKGVLVRGVPVPLQNRKYLLG